MADEVDIANELAAAEAEAGVRAVREGRSGPFANMKPNGFCRWCHDPVAPGRTHCAPLENSCADDHAKYIRFKRGS